jgi:cell division protein FtsW (lipid II flippase)
MMDILSIRPRPLLLICGAAAVGMGMAYMAAAGAPSRYLLVNLAALVLGATAWLALGRAARSSLAGAGAAVLGLAVTLLLTAFFGNAVEGASRWVSVGPLTLQVSLIVLPIMLVLYARRPDPLGTAGMIVGALALAVQPDRAMAGVMTAGLVGLLWASPGRLPLVAAIASIAAFGWTLLTPDALPAVPFVDGILYTAFEVHPLAGLAVVSGAVAVALPALIVAHGAADARPVLLAFGGCWSGVVLAAALGNYPTPLVGYGGSAILGYFLGGALLPGGAPAAGRRRRPTDERSANRRSPDGSTSKRRLSDAA